MLLPFRSNRLYKVFRWVSDSSQPHGVPGEIEETTSLDEFHTLLIDLDLPAMLVPSSTPGHSHLYIDKQVHWDQYVAILDALSAAGILEHGYVRASKKRGFTAVRLPWVHKSDR